MRTLTAFSRAHRTRLQQNRLAQSRQTQNSKGVGRFFTTRSLHSLERLRSKSESLPGNKRNRHGAENSNANPFVCGLSVPHQALPAGLPRRFGAPFIHSQHLTLNHLQSPRPLNPSEVPPAKRVVKFLRSMKMYEGPIFQGAPLPPIRGLSDPVPVHGLDGNQIQYPYCSCSLQPWISFSATSLSMM
jgi:hypothetical protein